MLNNRTANYCVARYATLISAAACDCNPRQHRLIWVGAACRLAVAALPPLTYVTLSLGYELDRFVQEQDDQGFQSQSLQPVLPELLQEVLLKALAHAKEKLVGTSCLGVCVLERFEFERADVIRNLRKSIARGRRIAVNNCLLGQCKLNGIMQRLGDQGLPVVVIDLNLIELLQVLKMIEQKGRDVPSDALDRTARCEHVGVEFGLLIGKRRIPKWEVLQKDAERRKVPLTLFNAHAFVLVVAVEQWREMRGNIPEPSSIQGFEVVGFVSGEPFALFVEHENYEVVLGFGTRITGFVNEYREILHSPHAPNNKNAGGKPPAAGGPPCGEDRLLYTTRRLDYSIIAKYEHMFSIQKGGIA